MAARERALLLLDTEARCSEVIQLDLADLDLDTRRLRILPAKGNNQRVVPFAGRCEAALRGYLEVRGDAPGSLFVAFSGEGTVRLGSPSSRTALK
jgi:integrase/recombinase XerC